MTAVLIIVAIVVVLGLGVAVQALEPLVLDVDPVAEPERILFTERVEEQAAQAHEGQRDGNGAPRRAASLLQEGGLFGFVADVDKVVHPASLLQSAIGEMGGSPL